MDYQEFLKTKEIRRQMVGFKPNYMPNLLKPFQSHLVDWSIRLGRSALLEDCGLGKTVQQLVWAENVIRHCGKGSKVLILTPLAVAKQTEREAKKFGMVAHKTQDGTLHNGINVTNYEQLAHYNPEDFAACVVDEDIVIEDVAHIARILCFHACFCKRLPECVVLFLDAAAWDETFLHRCADSIRHWLDCEVEAVVLVG